MKRQISKLTALFIIFTAILMNVACGRSQIEEANKAVDEANKKLEDAKALLVKTETRNTDLFSANIQTAQQFQSYKSNKTGEAREIVGDYEKISEMLKDIAKKYDTVSRMNVSEKYKDYAKLKADEFDKRSEAISVHKGNAQAFLEIDDPRTMTAKFDENNSKSERLFKDAEEMGTKAKKMEEENKDLFRQA